MPPKIGLRKLLAGAALTNICLRFAGLGLSFGTIVLLARTIGADGYGIYAYAYALVTLLAIPTQFGLPGLVIRETAAAHATSRISEIRPLWSWAKRIGSLTSAGAIIVCGVWVIYMSPDIREGFGQPLLWGLAAVPLLTIMVINGAALIGLRHIVLGSLSDQFVRPFIFFALVVAVGVHGAKNLTPTVAMQCYVASVLLACTASAVLVRRTAANLPRSAIKVDRSQAAKWIKSCAYLAALSGLTLINEKLDIVMLGWLRTPGDVGLYSVASQMAAAAAVVLGVANAITMPYFARFHKEGNRGSFQRLATDVSRACLLVSLPIAVVYLAFGQAIISSVFGSEYRSAAAVLSVLTIAQLISAAFGPLGPMLNMAGYERDTVLRTGLAALMNIILNAVLIPGYGAMGAAVATATTLVAWNIGLWSLIRKRLRVESGVWGANISRP